MRLTANGAFFLFPPEVPTRREFIAGVGERLLFRIYPEMSHVRDAGVNSAPDKDKGVWTYASKRELTIVTKDADFHHRSFLFGSPPKVIWID